MQFFLYKKYLIIFVVILIIGYIFYSKSYTKITDIYVDYQHRIQCEKTGGKIEKIDYQPFSRNVCIHYYPDADKACSDWGDCIGWKCLYVWNINEGKCIDSDFRWGWCGSIPKSFIKWKIVDGIAVCFD